MLANANSSGPGRRLRRLEGPFHGPGLGGYLYRGDPSHALQRQGKPEPLRAICAASGLAGSSASVYVIDDRGTTQSVIVAHCRRTIQDLDPPRRVHRTTVVSDVHNISSCLQGGGKLASLSQQIRRGGKTSVTYHY